jgi:ankyrin repeat protein
MIKKVFEYIRLWKRRDSFQGAGLSSYNLEKGTATSYKGDTPYFQISFAVTITKNVIPELIELKSHGSSLFYKTTDDIPALQKACRDCNLNVAQNLIDLGADVNLIGNDGRFSLYEACNGESLELIKMLITAGADINNTFATYPWTVIELARRNGHQEIVKYLAETIGANRPFEIQNTDEYQGFDWNRAVWYLA